MKKAGSLAILAIVLAACGGPTPAASQPGSATQLPAGPTNATPTSPPVAAGAGTSIHVVVASGPQAGTYDGTGVKLDCNTAVDGSGATYADTTKTEGVTALTFTSGEGGANPTKFYFQVLFGVISLQQPFLEISTLDPAAPRGSGTATLQDNGATINWTINGTSADGFGVQATVECGPVDRR